MSIDELRAKSVADLKDELIALATEQFNLRMQRGLGGKLRPDLFKKARRTVAQIKTILREKAKQ